MSAAPPPRLLDRVRQALRLRHRSPRTEEAYVAWIRRFILFHGKRHPGEMSAPEVVAFLSDLAVRGRVSASTQSQALAALRFLYDCVLERPASAPTRPLVAGSATTCTRPPSSAPSAPPPCARGSRSG
jgi:hypothetical protein